MSDSDEGILSDIPRRNREIGRCQGGKEPADAEKSARNAGEARASGTCRVETVRRCAVRKAVADMSKQTALDGYLKNLQLKRLGRARRAGLLISSVPWPRRCDLDVSLGGRPTFAQGLGQWPKQRKGQPRRMLLIADGDNDAPETLCLGKTVKPQGDPPSAQAERFARSEDPGFIWERHLLRIQYAKASLGLAMGLRTGGEVHWWEACRMVVLAETPTCRIVEMGGAIPLVHNGMKEICRYRSYRNPFLHHHNWLNGHIYARLHANGVCEIFAHHINSRFFDDGLPLKDAVPVIGFHLDGVDSSKLDKLEGVWDGSRREFSVGRSRIDAS